MTSSFCSNKLRLLKIPPKKTGRYSRKFVLQEALICLGQASKFLPFSLFFPFLLIVRLILTFTVIRFYDENKPSFVEGEQEFS